ncbi:hypothetical protein Tco_0838025 [Tanacetum coccineum]
MEYKAKEDKYLDEIIELEKLKKALDNVIYKMGQSMQTMHMLTKPQAFYDESHKRALGYQNPLYLSQAQRKVSALYCGNTIVMQHDALSVIDTEETLEMAEESRLKMHAKQNDPILKEKKVNIALIDYVALNKLISLVKDSINKIRNHVNDFENVVTVRTKVTGQNEGSWGFEHIRKAFDKDVKPFVKTLKEYFHMFDQGLHKEITDMKEVFTQMETEVAICSVDRKTFEIKYKELLLENEHLLELRIS